MSKTKLMPIDRKDLVPVAMGVAIGVGMMILFFVIAKLMDMATLVDHSALPRQ
jgi:hypothetical protein